MNKRLVMLIFLSFAIISAFADAKVFYIEQPASAYSIGDTLSVKIGTDGAESWVSVDLICGNKTKMLYYHHLTKTDVSAEITAPLTKEFLGGLSGSCYLSIISDAEEKKSITFDISGEIIPNINFGSSNSTITILQKPTMLIIDAPKKITPGQNFEFKIILSDQTGNTMD